MPDGPVSIEGATNNKLTRRRFLQLGAAAAAIASSMFPTKASAEDGPRILSRGEFLMKFAEEILEVIGPLPSLESDNKPTLAQIKETQVGSQGSYSKVETLKDYASQKQEPNSSLKQLGIKTGPRQLAGHLLDRTRRIYENPKKDLAENLDPGVDQINALVGKWSVITGIPEEIIMGILWQENACRGAFPNVHGDYSVTNSLTSVNIYHFSLSEIPTNSLQNARCSKFLFPAGENDQADSTIIASQIPSELIRCHSELNLIMGLYFYTQALEATLCDTEISNQFEKWKNENPNSPPFAFAYAIYNIGVNTIKLQLKGEITGKDANEVPLDIKIRADRFDQVLGSKPWTKKEFMGKSQREGDDNISTKFFWSATDLNIESKTQAIELPDIDKSKPVEQFLKQNPELNALLKKYREAIRTSFNSKNAIMPIDLEVAFIISIARDERARIFVKQRFPKAEMLHSMLEEIFQSMKDKPKQSDPDLSRLANDPHPTYYDFKVGSPSTDLILTDNELSSGRPIQDLIDRKENIDTIVSTLLNDVFPNNFLAEIASRGRINDQQHISEVTVASHDFRDRILNSLARMNLQARTSPRNYN